MNLEKVKIGRFDIHYFLANDFRDRKNLVENFFLKSVEHVLSKGIHAEIDKFGVLRIGERKSPNSPTLWIKRPSGTF